MNENVQRVFTPIEDTCYPFKKVASLLGISGKALTIRISKGKVPSPTENRLGELYWEKSIIDALVK